MFVIGADTAGVRDLVRALSALPGVGVGPAPTGLFAGGIERVWSDFRWVDHMGVAAMLSADELLGGLRWFCDEVLGAVRGPRGRFVEWSPEHASELAAAAMTSLYPDALFLVDQATARGAKTAVEKAAALGTRVVRLDAATAASDPQGLMTVLASAGGSGPADVGAPALAAPVSAGEVQRGSPLQERLILLAGCGRSGTTWLEELWLTHPQVGGLPGAETWLFEQLTPLWRNMDRADGGGVTAYLPVERATRAVRRLCDTLLTATMSRHTPGARYFVEKTPMHALRLADIVRAYPDAWLVHLLRDGRDVARSISRVPFFGLPDPGDAAALWVEVVDAVHSDAGGFHRFREVRYESVHADPVVQMSELFRWVGLPVDDDLRARLRVTAGQRVSTHAGTGLPVGPGGWRSMSARDLRRVHQVAGSMLVRTGYATESEVASYRRRRGPWSLTGGRRAAGHG